MNAPIRESSTPVAQIVLLTLSALILAAFLALAFGQASVFPGDRMRIESLHWNPQAMILQYSFTAGTLDGQGEYHRVSAPIACSLDFKEVTAECAGQKFEPSPSAYGDIVTQLNDLLEHAYALAQIVNEEREKNRKAER